MKKAMLLGLLIGTLAAGLCEGVTVLHRKYGVQTTIPIVIWDSNSPWALYETAPVAADTFIVKNTKAPAATSNAATDRGKTHDIVLTATEMAAKLPMLIVQDQNSPALYGDEVIIIHTFGDANAYEPFDTSSATPIVDVNKVSGSATAATNIEVVYVTDWATDYNTTSNMWNVDAYYVRGAEPLSDSNIVKEFRQGLWEAAYTDGNDNSPAKRIYDNLTGDIATLLGTPAVDVSTDINAISATLGTPAGADLSTDIAAVATDANNLAMALLAEDPTTVAAVTDADTFTLTAGSASNDYYNQCMIIVEDIDDSHRRAVRFIRDYTGATKTVQLDEVLPFTPVAGDKVYIYMNRAVGRGRVSGS